MNYQGLMEITKIENIADDVYEMTLKGEGAKYISQPGQFINIKINESLQPYLRRPMSISDYDENTIVIVFKVVGQGTEILKNKQIGDQFGLFNWFRKWFYCSRRKSFTYWWRTWNTTSL